jgi:hypothetical protein
MCLLGYMVIRNILLLTLFCEQFRMCNKRCGRHAIVKDLIDKAMAVLNAIPAAPVTPATSGPSTPSKSLGEFIAANAAAAADLLHPPVAPGSTSSKKGETPSPTAAPASGPSLVFQFVGAPSGDGGNGDGNGGGGKGASVPEPKTKKPKRGSPAATIPSGDGDDGGNGDGNGGGGKGAAVPEPKTKKPKSGSPASTITSGDGDDGDDAMLLPKPKRQKGKGPVLKAVAGSSAAGAEASSDGVVGVGKATAPPDASDSATAPPDASDSGGKPVAAMTGVNPLDMLDADFMHALEAISGACGQGDVFMKLIGNLKAASSNSSSGSGGSASSKSGLILQPNTAVAAAAAVPEEDDDFDLEVWMVRVTEH